MREASYYETEGDRLRCTLCPHFCLIGKGKRGICGVRENREGKLVALTYGKAAAIALDPIEKKPLYHFYPGRDILSLGATGCNFHCGFCQNWHLVEASVPLKDVKISSLAEMAGGGRSIGISYTYNEPLIQWEFVYDCSRKFQEKGLKNVLVTNGFVNPDPLEELLPHIDGMNIDLKFFRESTYKKISGGSLEPVKKTIERASKLVHVEVTTLVVTGLNDSLEEIGDIVDFIRSLDPRIPYHLSRYFPGYRFDAPPTDINFLKEAYEMAGEKLSYVYLGNFHLPGSSDTRCPKCGTLLIERSGYSTKLKGLSGNRCVSCRAAQNFVM